MKLGAYEFLHAQWHSGWVLIVNRIIHFGPAKNLECYIQECGRSGRNGQPSVCLLLYNGLLAAHCNMDIKEYSYTTIFQEITVKRFLIKVDVTFVK